MLFCSWPTLRKDPNNRISAFYIKGAREWKCMIPLRQSQSKSIHSLYRILLSREENSCLVLRFLDRPPKWCLIRSLCRHACPGKPEALGLRFKRSCCYYILHSGLLHGRKPIETDYEGFTTVRGLPPVQEYVAIGYNELLTTEWERTNRPWWNWQNLTWL